MKDNNILVLTRLSAFLNNNPDYINEDMINELVSEDITEISAVRILLSSILNIYDNKEIMDMYVKEMIFMLDSEVYKEDPYYKNIKLDNIKTKNWEIVEKCYKPYELFVMNDIILKDDGRVIPQIGFFTSTYKYISVLQNGNIWMLITPNEIETMKKPIKECYGDVLTYGLGLGYFAYMASIKEEVKSITIIECDQEVIDIFNNYILPQFQYKSKIRIIREDAYVYASKKIFYDCVFVDIWHDVSDGIDAYLKFKSLEIDGVNYFYWIEDTIKCYLKESYLLQ